MLKHIYILFKFWSGTICGNENNKEECKLSVQDDFVRLTLDVLGECVFGYKFDSIEAGHTPISKAFNDVTSGPDATALNTMLLRLLDLIPFYQGSKRRRETFKTTMTTVKQVWFFSYYIFRLGRGVARG